MNKLLGFVVIVLIVLLSAIGFLTATLYSTHQTEIEMKLFQPGDVVTFSENHKAVGPDHFWLDSAGTPVTFAEVLDESTSGTVEVYDPKTKVNRQIHRSYLQLKDPK